MKLLITIQYKNNTKQFYLIAKSILGADRIIKTKYSNLLAGADKLSIETI